MDNVGKMRHRIRIASRQTSRDEIGGDETTWQLTDELFASAKFRPTGTDELNSSGQNSPDTKVDFTIRHRELSYDNEVIYEGKRYQIEGLIPDEHKNYLIIETKQTGKDYVE